MERALKRSLIPVVLLLLARSPSVADEIAVADRLETVADRVIPALMEQYGVPGGVYCIVDGTNFRAKGFGVADLETKRPVHPTDTLFRVASLSKSFVALAVLQLESAGKLELDMDVNRYLDTFQLPSTYPDPITLHHLLTHTAGFEENNIGRATRRVEDAPSLENFLASFIPSRVRPVGTLSSYSNYGFALAGLIVEKFSGQPFDRYVAEAVLGPLEMNRSGFCVPEDLSAVAVGHERVDGKVEPVILDWDNGYPASMLFTTADDMARYVVAHVNDGRMANDRFAEPLELDRLHARSFVHHPRLEASGYGFFERLYNGSRVIQHSGYWKGFLSQVCLVPDRDAGFFFSFNSADARAFRSFLANELLDALLPQPEEGLPGDFPSPVRASGIERVRGSYRSIESSQSTVERIAILFDTARVTTEPEGRIRFRGRAFVHARSPDPAHLLFEPVGKSSSLSPGPVLFRQDASGAVTHLLSGHRAYERVPWYESERFQILYVGTPSIILALALVIWPPIHCVRIIRKKPELASTLARSAQLLAWVTSSLNLAFLLILFLVVREALGRNGGEFAYGVPPLVIALQVTPHLTSLLAVILVLLAFPILRRGAAPLPWRAAYLLCAVANLTYLPFFLHWNLLGFRF